MTDDRRDEPGQDTGAFDPDEWFRTQFGAQPPGKPTSVPEPPPVVVPTAVPVAVPPAVPPVVVLPSGAPATFAPPPPLVEPPPTMPAMLPPTTQALLELEPTQLTPIIVPELTQPSEIVVPAAALGDAGLGDAGLGAAALGDAATELIRQPEEGGALDELFGNGSFREYDEPLIPTAPRSTGRDIATAAAGAGGVGTGGAGTGGDGTMPNHATPRAPIGRAQKTLLWVAGSLVAALALVLIFFAGTRIPLLLGSAPGAEPTPPPTPTPTPTLTERPVGPVEAGDYRWDALWGGECLEPFGDAWQDEYTVVDCAAPHSGQLADRAPFPWPEGSDVHGPFPGQEALAAQISLLCSRPGVLDLVAAAPFTDIQVQGAYAVTEEQWNEGMNDFFCFVSRSSGEPLTQSIVPVG